MRDKCHEQHTALYEFAEEHEFNVWLNVYKLAEGSKHKWLKIPSFWDTTLRNRLSGFWRFETQFDGFVFKELLTLEDEVTMFLLQVRDGLPAVTALYPRGKESSAVSLWQPEGWLNWPSIQNSRIMVITRPLQEATHFNILQGIYLENSLL